MRRSLVVTLALGAGSSAHAEGPIVVRAGLGVTADRDRNGFDEVAIRFGPALHADIGYRFHDRLAAGVRFGITRNWDTEIEYRRFPDSMFEWHLVFTSLQIGVGAQYCVGRLWLVPWIGVDDRNIESDGTSPRSHRQLAFGLGAGADLFRDPSGHRVGAYLDVTRGQRTELDDFDGRTYSFANVYVSAGVTYRYW